MNLDPVQNFFHSLQYSVTSRISLLFNQNKQEEKINLVPLQVELTRLQKENQLLREELKMVPVIKFNYKSVKIFQITQFKGEEALVIAAGLKEGIKVGDFVLNTKGLIGRVVKSDNFAIVAPLGSESIKIPAIVIPSAQTCIVGKNLASSDDLELNISYLKENNAVKEGDIVVSSWQEGLPFGIEIGYLIKVDGKFRVRKEKNLLDSQLVQVLIRE